MTLTTCCNGADQLLLLVLIFKDIYKKHDFGDGLPPESDVYMNQNLLYFSADLFIKRFTEYFLKPEIQGKVILLLHCHRIHCSSPLLLQTAVKNNVTIILLQSHCTLTLKPLDKCFFGGSLNYYLKNDAAACKITRYRMASLTEFAWGKDVSVGDGLFQCQPFQPQQSACMFVLLFSHQRNHNLYGNSTSKYGSVLCNLYFSNQISKCVTHFRRTFIKYS